MRGETAWRRGAPGGAVLCGIPVVGGSSGVPMQSSFLPGLPGLGQSLLISALLAGFVAAGIWMFKRWGGSAGSARAADVTSPAHGSDDLWEELERDLSATGESATVSPNTEDREPASV